MTSSTAHDQKTLAPEFRAITSRVPACVVLVLVILTGYSARAADAKKPASDRRETGKVVVPIKVDRRYLNLPVRLGEGKPQRWIRMVDASTGDLEYEFHARLDFENPQGYAFVDLDRWMGRALVVEVEGISEGELARLQLSDEITDRANIYREPLRPGFHYTTRRGMLSDANGLFHHRGKWFMCYQHFPFDPFTDWQEYCSVSWGLAVSDDLVDWEERGDVLLPDAMGPAFSGSAVVDIDDVSGLGRGDHPPILLYYTAAGGKGRRSMDKLHTVCLAVSADGGETFVKYPSNPIVSAIAPGNRDPKVAHDAKSGRWIMLVYSDAEGYITLTSSDLLSWKPLPGRFRPKDRECPDLFCLPMDGNTEDRRWVFLGAGGGYALVDVTSEGIVARSEERTFHGGGEYYAGQTFNNATDGRVILVARFNNWFEGELFFNSMTVPLELSLMTDRAGRPQLVVWPVKEFDQLREEKRSRADVVLRDGLSLDAPALADLEATIEDATDLTLTIHGSTLRWEASRGKVRWDGKEYTVPAAASPMNVRILVDRSGIEVFEKHSGVYLPLTARFNPDAPRHIDLRADGDGVVKTLELWRLREMSRGPSGARDDDPIGSSKSERHPDPESPHGSGNG